MALEGTFAYLEQLGAFDVFLPFVLVFVIVFAILQKVQIFGDPTKVKNTKNFNMMIALVMGLAVIFPHILGYYPPDQDIVLIINHALPNVSIVLVAILMALLIIGLLGKRFEIGGNSLSGWIAIAAFALIVYIFGSAANWWSAPSFLWFITANPDLMALVIVILVFAIIVHFITKEETPNTPKYIDPNSTAMQVKDMLK
jgi:hypothetical protein